MENVAKSLDFSTPEERREARAKERQVWRKNWKEAKKRLPNLDRLVEDALTIATNYKEDCRAFDLQHRKVAVEWHAERKKKQDRELRALAEKVQRSVVRN